MKGNKTIEKAPNEEYLDYSRDYWMVFVDGEPAFFREKDTGKDVPGVRPFLPAEGKYIDKKELERRKKYREKEEQKQFRKENQKSAGDFIFIANKERIGDMNAQTLARLIFLSTYCGFDEDVIRFDDGTPVLYEHLKDLMNMKRGTFYNFWKDVNGKFIEESSDKLLHLKITDFVKGKLSSKRFEFRKLYVKQMRDLYNSTPTHKMKSLGRIFQLIPYINGEWNIICHNPLEKELNNIESVTVKELCNMIKYGEKDYRRIIKEYTDLTFDLHGETHTFCSFVLNSDTFGDARIMVNPNIIYNGSHLEQVSAMGYFCKKKDTTQDRKENFRENP